VSIEWVHPLVMSYLTRFEFGSELKKGKLLYETTSDIQILRNLGKFEKSLMSVMKSNPVVPLTCRFERAQRSQKHCGILFDLTLTLNQIK
jgi:hypothetical protein